MEGRESMYPVRSEIRYLNVVCAKWGEVDVKCESRWEETENASSLCQKSSVT
jgi:hypothetical protein